MNHCTDSSVVAAGVGAATLTVERMYFLGLVSRLLRMMMLSNGDLLTVPRKMERVLDVGPEIIIYLLSGFNIMILTSKYILLRE